MSSSQLACTYAALALFDDDLEVTSEKIQIILKAANVEVESYWPGLFAQLIKDKGMAALLTGAAKGGGGGGSVKAAVTEAKDGVTEEKEAEKEESEEQESSASGPGLFGDDSSSDESS